jgi:hypothetical protein
MSESVPANVALIQNLQLVLQFQIISQQNYLYGNKNGGNYPGCRDAATADFFSKKFILADRARLVFCKENQPIVIF